MRHVSPSGLGGQWTIVVERMMTTRAEGYYGVGVEGAWGRGCLLTSLYLMLHPSCGVPSGLGCTLS
jgi:hypothetical protein